MPEISFPEGHTGRPTTRRPPPALPRVDWGGQDRLPSPLLRPIQVRPGSGIATVPPSLSDAAGRAQPRGCGGRRRVLLYSLLPEAGS